MTSIFEAAYQRGVAAGRAGWQQHENPYYVTTIAQEMGVTQA